MEILFFLMSAIIVTSAIGVVALRNPMYSALSLILNLVTVAGIFAQLEAHFLSAVQIIVYAGAIMVLVLFVLMLLNLKVEEQQRPSLYLTMAAVVLGCLFVAMVIPSINDAFKVFPDPAHPVVGTVKNMGEVLYTKYVFPFEAASILIMAAIVGAVMLAKRKVTDANLVGTPNPSRADAKGVAR
jgi:NADH-quinone oxidoreductase subunit J